MSVIPDALYHLGGIPVGGIQTWDVGNIYFVIDPDHPQYNDFMKQRQTGSYANDGTSMVHSTIQAALNATVTERNDYVVVVPHPHTGVYIDHTAALTMTKNRVHLICPSNFGLDGMGFKSPVINHYGTATTAAITLSGHNCEIGGLLFRSANNKDTIDVGSGTQGLNVHDNFFGMSSSDGSTNKAIDASVVHYFNIHNNHFTNFNPGAMTSTDNDLEYFIYISSSSSTRGRIVNNTMCTGNNTEVTAAISVNGSDLLIRGNVMWETSALGAAEAGTLTAGIIYTNGNGLVIDNRIAITDTSAAISVSGAAAVKAVACINNYSSLDGGTIVTGG